jgi:hypothetical protein
MPDSECSAEEQARFLRKHQDCCNNNSALIVPTVPPIVGDPVFDYYLAPIWGTGPQLQGDRKSPVFAVYAVGNRPAIDFLLGKVIYARRLPVVFDLDETLIKAKSVSNLSDEEILKAIERREEDIKEDKNTSPAQKRTHYQELELEVKMLRQDADSLRSYKNEDAVYNAEGTRVGSEYVQCPFYPEDSVKLCSLRLVTRPIIRLQPDVIFTRIRPNDKVTSMVFRVRPYWPEVRSLLTGGMDKTIGNNDPSSARNAKPLIEAFVCTTADTEYAHEAWRVLDLNEALIPHNRWPKRIISKAGNQKRLGLTLQLPDYVFTKSSIMPFAVILDDLPIIWEPKVQDQVIHVSKWNPYEEYGRVTHSKEHWEKAPAGLEMLKLGGVLRALQKQMFQQIDSLQASLPPGNIIAVDLTQLETSYASVFAAPPWTSRLLPQILNSATPLPLPAKSLAIINAQEVKIKEMKKQMAESATAAAALPAPQDPRIAARAAQKQKEEQQREEPAEFNPETDGDVFANWGKMVTTTFTENEAAKNKRKRQTSDDDDMEEAENERSSSLENDASDVLRDRDNAINFVSENEEEEEEEEQGGRARKKAQPPKEDPIILLSLEAQRQGKHLMTTTEKAGTGGYFTIIKVDNKRIGFSHGLSLEESRKNAAVKALDDLQGGGSGLAAPEATVGQKTQVLDADGGDNVVYFNDSLNKIRDLYPTTGQGQKVLYRELTEPGDLVTRFQCTVRRDFNSGQRELTAVGVGDGFYSAKRAAARMILEELGYHVV